MSNDCISRQNAYDTLTDYYHHTTQTQHDALRDALNRVPSVQPEQRWIPCSERFPESGRYLVSCQLSVFSPQVLNYDENNGEWFYDGCKSMDFEMPTINAWMPLPEPYRGDEP